MAGAAPRPRKLGRAIGTSARGHAGQGEDAAAKQKTAQQAGRFFEP